MKFYKIALSIFTLVLMLVLGVSLTSCNDKKELSTTQVDTTTNLNALNEGLEPYSIDNDINTYIAGKTSQNELYYLYDLIVNQTSNWKKEIGVFSWFLDENDEVVLDESLSINYTFTFEKGYAYLINMVIPVYKSFNGKNFTKYYVSNSEDFTNVFGPFIPKNYFFNYDIMENFYNYYDNGVMFDWDNQNVCSSICSNYKRRVNEIYVGTKTYVDFLGKNNCTLYENGCPMLIVPNETFSVSLLEEELYRELAGAEVYIFSSKLSEKDYVAPVFEKVELSVDVDNQPSLEEILSNVIARDNVDGLVPVVLDEANTTYNPNEKKVGNYVVSVIATDSSSNTNTYLIPVSKIDNTAPIIEGQTEYILNYDNDLSIEDIEENLTITDNVDSGLTLNVVSDNFTANKNILGTYQVVFNTTDKSNNTSANKTITLKVQNQGKSIIVAPREIKVSVNMQMSIDEFKNNIVITDGYDGVVENYVIEGLDEYSGTWFLIGSNDVTVSYTNSGNNVTTATISLIKVDEELPNFYFNSKYFAFVPLGETFTIRNLRSCASKLMRVAEEEIVEISGDYDTNTAGTYDVDLLLKDGSTEKFKVCVGNTYNEEYQVIQNPFISEFWQQYVDNLFVCQYWSWGHYATLVLLGVFLIGVIVMIVKIKNRRSNNIDYDNYNY